MVIKIVTLPLLILFSEPVQSASYFKKVVMASSEKKYAMITFHCKEEKKDKLEKFVKRMELKWRVNHVEESKDYFSYRSNKSMSFTVMQIYRVEIFFFDISHSGIKVKEFKTAGSIQYHE